MGTLSIRSLYSFQRSKIFQSKITTNEKDLVVIITEMSPDLRFNPICSNCKSIAEGIHSWNQRLINDLPVCRFINRINLSYRKIYCPKCSKVKVEELDIADPGGPRVTRRMARYIYDLCKLMSVKDVAEHLHLDWKTVKKIDKTFLEKEFGETDYSNLTNIAMDEISYGSHHKYLTVVIDFDTGRVVWVGKDRKINTLDTFFEKMPEQLRDNIDAVAMDMWDPYITATRKWCPNAEIVFDKFHIISHYSDVIDQVRRDEQKKTQNEEERRVIKGSRWLLLKNEDNLKLNEQVKLNALLDLNKNLLKVHILKDELKLIWNSKDHYKMEKSFNSWISKALEVNLPPVDKFIKMLLKHKDGILSYSNYRIHTCKSEGTNNKIKEIKRSAFGFHDQRYFALKIKQAFPGNSNDF